MLNATIGGYVGNAEAKMTEVKGVPKLVVNFGVCSNAHVNGKDVKTWVQVALWEKQAEAFIENRPHFVMASGELFERKFTRNDGTPGTELKMHRANVQWGPVTGKHCKLTDLRTSVATGTPDVAAIAAALGADPAVIAEVMQKRASAPAPATPAAEAPVEIDFDFDDDPFAAD